MVAQLDSTFVREMPGRAASRLVGYSLFEGRPATTKGRWWNPVVFANLRAAARASGQRVDRPIFIVGMGRSGTTLLGRILAAHPSVGFLNEPKAMWHVIRPDEDIIGSYGEPGTGRLYLDAEDADIDVSRRAHALFSWYCTVSRSERVVDKYPELVFRPSFVSRIFPDARFLVAVRSPWSTLASVAAWSDSHTRDEADWWGVRDQKWKIMWAQGVDAQPRNKDVAELRLGDETDHFVRAAIEWIVTMREALSFSRSQSAAHLIDYDTLTTEPTAMIRTALDFCQLPQSPRTERYAATIVVPSDAEKARDVVSSHHLPPALSRAVEQTWSDLSNPATNGSP